MPKILALTGRLRVRLALIVAQVVAVSALGSSPRAGAAEGRGEQVYREKCASCHGGTGQGSVDYPRPLQGDRSIGQLTKLIEKTMPEDDPGTCVGEDAQQVAAYIHEAFYSPTAQARYAPPRVALSRLTVRQYRNAVADLIGSFREPGKTEPRRGLHAHFFKAKQFKWEDWVLERDDLEVRFNYGKSSPVPDKMDPKEFAARWEGSVLAPETGEYEFVVRTENSARLWVNNANQERPLIDAWVKSGNDTEYRGSIRLLGGRWYPIKLEWFKATQGVEQSKKQKAKAEVGPASIALEWKLPKRAAEVIPRQNLAPFKSPILFVCETAFPPDDRSIGYERGTSVSKAWDGATTDAAIEVATYVNEHLRELSGASKDAGDRAEKFKGFCRTFVERAFRRPLSDEQRQFFVDRLFAEGGDPELAVKKVVLLALKSPRFLYREVGGERPDPYDVASRIAFGLWDSMPDKALLEAAAADGLKTPDQVRAQAERMIGDPRARSKVRDFLLAWLKVDHIPDIAKDPKRFPEFTPEIASDLRTSLDLFIDDVVWGESSDFRQLLKADYLYLNGRLARFYGADMPAEAPFEKTTSGPKERAGILSHPYLMASFAYTATSSPIHRGVFLARSVLGRTLRPPPEAFAPLAPDLHPELTTRERVALQTQPQACVTCHSMINPLGFALENFDAVGRYREEEQGRPIDSTGSYQARTGDTVQFGGVRGLAEFLAGSEETHRAFVEQLFHAIVKQPIRTLPPDAVTSLQASFGANNFSVRKLMVEIVAASAGLGREAKP